MRLKVLRRDRIRSLKDEDRGSITVFLSFLIFLVLAVVGALLEGARVQTAENMADRALGFAMDAALTKYYRPLYDDYHLFFLRDDEGREENGTGALFQSVREYLLETFPSGGLSGNLLDLEIGEGAVERITRAPDYNGVLFLNEAAAYMKYKCPEESLEQFLDISHSFAQTAETARVIEKKQEAEEELGELNKDLLDIMELIEGLSVNRKGIQYTQGGRIRVKKTFVKKFCPTGGGQSSLGIRHSLVWESLQGSYVNPVQELNRISEQLGDFIQEEEPGEKEEKAEAKRRRKKLSSIRGQKKRLTNMAGQIRKKLDRAVSLIDGLRQKQEKAEERLEEFGTFLKDRKEKLDESVYKGLKEDMEAMKGYVATEKEGEGSDSVIARVLNMKPVLLKNKSLLEEWEPFCGMSVTRDADVLAELKAEADRLKYEMQNYETASLAFDYSNLISKPDSGDPAKALKKLLRFDLLELVIPEKAVSNQKISKADRMKSIYYGSAKQSLPETDYSKLLKDSADKGYQKGLTGSFGEAGRQSGRFSLPRALPGKTMKTLLLCEYAKEHWKRYGEKLEEEEGVLAMKSALSYEQEYLAAGKSSDRDNLGTVVRTLVFMRTVCDFISLLRDREKGEQAYAAAAALVGFTGLEPLIRLTRTLILIIWGFDEALVDASALLDGKEVSVLKDAMDFSFSFPELLSVSRDVIQKKAAALKEGEKRGIRFSYEDYLKIFLFMENREVVCYRMMDLIQENLRLRYDGGFSMENCIYGFQTRIKYKIPARFMLLPFTRAYQDKSEWNHESMLECTY